MHHVSDWLKAQSPFLAQHFSGGFRIDPLAEVHQVGLRKIETPIYPITQEKRQATGSEGSVPIARQHSGQCTKTYGVGRGLVDIRAFKKNLRKSENGAQRLDILV